MLKVVVVMMMMMMLVFVCRCLRYFKFFVFQGDCLKQQRERGGVKNLKQTFF